VELSSHPASGAGAARRIAVDIGWHPQARELALRYRLEASADRLLVPPPRSPVRADGLWRHTCFEVFAQPEGGEHYLEFNFSPSGEWAAYGFEGRRRGKRDLDLVSAPRIECTRAAGSLDLGVTLRLDALPARAVRVGLSAVVEDRGGAVAWWALRHAAGPPDFHDPDSFTLRLEAPGPASAASVIP
jgi:hypothetical protein